MNDTQASEPLAHKITQSILAIPHVRGLFPHSVVAAAVGVLIGAASAATTALVELDRTDTHVAISARLAIDSRASSADTAEAAHRAIAAVLGTSQFFTLHIEIAHID